MPKLHLFLIRSRLPEVFTALAVLGAGGAARGVEPTPPAAPAVSTFAPAADLIAAARGYAESFAAPTSDAAQFASAQAKILKDSHTLAAIALALALSDEDHPLKKSSGDLLAAAQGLAQASDVENARQAAEKIKAAVADGASGTATVEPATWHKVASMGQLMKQVTFLNNRLKRGLQKNRFEQMAGDTAQFSAQLAVIAQAVTGDTHEVQNPADTDKWFQFSAEMRDAAGELNQAIHAKNFDAATAANARLEKSCATCHEVFHNELAQ
ncbi:MAG: hypothetical protein JNG90_11555 [Planctomycetaceae bacterium]|nr:hypothetical protein [Planctomycetaceae bacterium]